MRSFVKIPSHQLACAGTAAKGKALQGHTKMLSDRETCLMGAEGKEQQREKERKSKCDLSEQGGK